MICFHQYHHHMLSVGGYIVQMDGSQHKMIKYQYLIYATSFIILNYINTHTHTHNIVNSALLIHKTNLNLWKWIYFKTQWPRSHHPVINQWAVFISLTNQIHISLRTISFHVPIRQKSTYSANSIQEGTSIFPSCMKEEAAWGKVSLQRSENGWVQSKEWDEHWGKKQWRMKALKRNRWWGRETTKEGFIVLSCNLIKAMYVCLSLSDKCCCSLCVS